MRRKMTHFTLIGSLTVCFVYAQSTNREFDGASVKPNRSGNGVMGGCRGINSKSGSDVQATVPLQAKSWSTPLSPRVRHTAETIAGVLSAFRDSVHQWAGNQA